MDAKGHRFTAEAARRAAAARKNPYKGGWKAAQEARAKIDLSQVPTSVWGTTAKGVIVTILDISQGAPPIVGRRLPDYGSKS